MSGMVDKGKAVEKKAKSDTGTDATTKDYYKDAYSHFGIHEEMLKDEVRTRSYMSAIENNRHLFEGKVVLDVGCGTGILCMFAARAGAAKVYGIECSGIIKQARQIVEANGYSDTIELIAGKLEDVELPCGPGKKVDIIVSEWMGYFLLYESMLATVLLARDRWLRPGGLMLPDKAILYLGAIEDEEFKSERIGFWDSVYGFDMSVIKEIAYTEPLVDVVDGKAVISNFAPIHQIDLLTCPLSAASSFSSPFSIKFDRSDYCHALVAYFEIAFTQIHKPIAFSTSPFARYTHWKQTVFYLKESLTVGAGDELSGTITCQPNAKNERDLNVTVEASFQSDRQTWRGTQHYRLR